MKKLLFIILNISTCSLFAQIGIGTTSPASSAALELSSNSKGFLPPRMTYSQRNAIEPAATAAGLQVWCTDCGTNGELSIFNGVYWTNSTGDIAAYAPPIGGNAICDGSRPTVVKDVSFTHNGTTYTYMDRNLGASRAATTYNDYLAYGCLYQWGRGNDGHASVNWTSSTNGTNINGSTSTKSSTVVPLDALFITNTLAQNVAADWMTSTPSPDNRWNKLSGNNNPCPSGYRIPNNAEIAILMSKFSGSSTNATSWFSNELRFPVAGYFTSSLVLTNTNSNAFISYNFIGEPAGLVTGPANYTNTSFRNRSYAYSIRCIKSTTDAY